MLSGISKKDTLEEKSSLLCEGMCQTYKPIMLNFT